MQHANCKEQREQRFNSSLLYFGAEKKETMDSVSRQDALSQRLILPVITIPFHLKSALKHIYGLDYSYLKEKSFFDLNLHNSYVRRIENLSNIQTITQQDYLMIMKMYLYLMQFEQDLKIKRYRLFNHTVKKSNLKDCFIIDLKSFNGNHDCINGCNVILNETLTKEGISAEVLKVLGNKVMIKAESQDANILQCWILNKRRFDIYFWSKHWQLRCSYYALMLISEHNWIEIIYPQLKTNCIDMEIDIQWINTNINEQQQQAVKKILTKTHPAPYIIFGPPGTGKTATLVEAICQIERQFPMKNILVCTVSNAAADEITKRLMKIIPNLIYRIYAPSREWSTVDKEIRPCANFFRKENIFLQDELLRNTLLNIILSRKRVVITTLITSIRLIKTLKNFSYLIIDEASQAIEPEMLIPLVIMNSKIKETEFQGQIVIAGDPYQLGPVVSCKRIEHLFGKSMLERLMNDCDPYKKQDGKYNPNYITKLIKNYRSHESLLHVSNKEFYSNELEICGGADTQIALNWSQLPNKNFPMIFQEVLGNEERSKTQSVSNMNEILAVLIYVDILMKSKFGGRKITPKDIGIITPFKQQQLDISYYLAAMKLKDITVGTVETFQGQERNVIILSTVRSKIFEHDGKEHIGFLSNPKRFNVALTRPKALMIIIGNYNILCKDKHWEVLWEHCKKHDAYVVFKELPLNEDTIATLKNIAKNKSCNNSGASNTERRKTLLDVHIREVENLKLKEH